MRLRYNGVQAALAADLTDSATTATLDAALSHSGGMDVPTIASPDYLPVAVLDSTGALTEVVYVTAYTAGGTSATISRGQEGTSGAAHLTGDLVVNAPTVSDVAPFANVVDVVLDCGAKIDGSTDDTAAWQAAINKVSDLGGGKIVSSKPGVSIIGGALQDTSGANAQLTLPSLDVIDDEGISIVIEGPWPPPVGVSVIGATPVPENHLVLKSTLTTGSGGNMIGAVGPVGTFSSFTYLGLTVRNVTLRMPANPTHTALDGSRLVSLDCDHVVVDTGSYDVDALTQPSTSTSYGIRHPKVDNGAFNRGDSVWAVGFYTGFQFSEHSTGDNIVAMGCSRAFEFATGGHASNFQRMLVQHCTTPVVFTGTHYVNIDQLDIEHANSGQGWRQTTNDVDDASNLGHGRIKWHTTLAGTGYLPSFVVNGGANLATSQLGVEAGGSSLTVQDEGGTVATGVTQIDFQGAGVTAASGSGEVVVTISGGSSSGGELLMQDGVTAPPVPLETEDRSDWLYQG